MFVVICRLRHGHNQLCTLLDRFIVQLIILAFFAIVLLSYVKQNTIASLTRKSRFALPLIAARGKNYASIFHSIVLVFLIKTFLRNFILESLIILCIAWWYRPTRAVELTFSTCWLDTVFASSDTSKIFLFRATLFKNATNNSGVFQPSCARRLYHRAKIVVLSIRLEHPCLLITFLFKNFSSTNQVFLIFARDRLRSLWKFLDWPTVIAGRIGVFLANHFSRTCPQLLHLFMVLVLLDLTLYRRVQAMAVPILLLWWLEYAVDNLWLVRAGLWLEELSIKHADPLTGSLTGLLWPMCDVCSI